MLPYGRNKEIVKRMAIVNIMAIHINRGDYYGKKS